MDALEPALANKYADLRRILAQTGGVAVCFSGGVDSALLLSVAHDVLGERCAAVTVTAPFMARAEFDDATRFCKERGIRHELVRIESIKCIERFVENPPDRCYHCKRALLGRVGDKARELGLVCVAEGSNTSDEGDWRPGLRAVAELGVRSPLREAGLSKADVRAISRWLGLPTWDKPSAACLASRIPYGQCIDERTLSLVDAAEAYLHGLGFVQCRVRVHGEEKPLARVEVPAGDIARAAQLADDMSAQLRQLGFAYVTLDLQGFRSGSMNEVL